MKPTQILIALLVMTALVAFGVVGVRRTDAGHIRRVADQSEREPVTGNACGVERWSVKTGTDGGARSVNQRYHFPTTISRLDALTPPGALPSYSRVRPVESTVYTLDATLLRYKQEADSDYHLVLTDARNTMIAEIPAAYCTGANSPFLSGIRTARYQFSQHYTVESAASEPDDSRCGWRRHMTLMLSRRFTGPSSRTGGRAMSGTGGMDQKPEAG